MVETTFNCVQTNEYKLESFMFDSNAWERLTVQKSNDWYYMAILGTIW